MGTPSLLRYCPTDPQWRATVVGQDPWKDAHDTHDDAAVLAADAMAPRADLLPQWLALTEQVAAKEETGAPVTPPGVPASYGDASKLASEDCIRP
jgi:hypothetical protein